MNIRNIIGEVFGRLTVIEFYESRLVKNGKKQIKKRFYKAKCICGNEVIVQGNNLVHGKTRSCGCLAKELKIERNNKKRLPNNKSLWNLAFHNHKKAANARNINNFLTFEEFKEICSQNCYYCGESPVKKTHPNLHGEIFKNGIDRIDSKKDYSIDNVRPCCSKCNYMKLDLSETEFFEQITKIFNKLNNETTSV